MTGERNNAESWKLAHVFLKGISKSNSTFDSFKTCYKL